MNKTVLITGACINTGVAIVEKFASEGYHVIFTGRNAEKVHVAEKGYREKFPAVEIIGYHMDSLLDDRTVDEESVEKMFSDMLYTKSIPNPDIVIRTGGEMRVSNYLLWQIAYSELFFSPTLWPDFNAKELEQIIQKFNQRERRYGKG